MSSPKQAYLNAIFLLSDTNLFKIFPAWVKFKILLCRRIIDFQKILNYTRNAKFKKIKFLLKPFRMIWSSWFFSYAFVEWSPTHSTEKIPRSRKFFSYLCHYLQIFNFILHLRNFNRLVSDNRNKVLKYWARRHNLWGGFH